MRCVKELMRESWRGSFLLFSLRAMHAMKMHAANFCPMNFSRRSSLCACVFCCADATHDDEEKILDPILSSQAKYVLTIFRVGHNIQSLYSSQLRRLLWLPRRRRRRKRKRPPRRKRNNLHRRKAMKDLTPVPHVTRLLAVRTGVFLFAAVMLLSFYADFLYLFLIVQKGVFRSPLRDDCPQAFQD